jgi:putative phosphoribosyl transferase
MIFRDRQDAGSQLASHLLKYRNEDALILALPRGGVPVGYEVAMELNLPLKALPVRKIGASFNPEYAIGAIAPNDVLYLEEEAINRFDITEEKISDTLTKEKDELKRREKLYQSGSLSFKNKLVILVDDGLATGSTMKAAIISIKKDKPSKIVVAVPCCPIEAVDDFEKLVDEFIYIEAKDFFTSVGSLYNTFEQVSDEEVIAILAKSTNFQSTN